MSTNYNEIIVDLLRELREEQKGITTLQHKHTIILTTMRSDVSKNTDDLEKHIEGVVQNRTSISNNQKETNIRLANLESPYKFVKSAVKVLKWVGSIAGSVLIIAGAARLFGWL